ncbi:MAG TPA: WD40 repeat domain-containing protein [Thermoanaerobaculia bacterium]|jgi:WD40 repeat protein
MDDDEHTTLSSEPEGRFLKIVVFVVVLLVAGFGIRYFMTREAASAERRTRVLRLDPRKVEPATRALLLLETIPELRDAERDLAVKQLRGALAAIPRVLLVHRPSFEIETLRFSGDGRAMLWHDKPAADGRIRIEKSFSRPASVVDTTGAWYATFRNEAGTRLQTGDPDRAKENGGTGPRPVMSSDGAYLALVRDDLLYLWRVEEEKPAAFLTDLPPGTTRVHCVRATELCALESGGRFTVVDVKKGRALRSIAVNRTAVVRMSRSGRLVGVAAPRAGITIHAARDGRTTRLDTAGLAVDDFAFSADEKKVLAIDGEGMLHSYDAATGKALTRSPLLRSEQWKSPTRVDAVGDGRFVVWDAAKVRLVSADLSAVTARFDDSGEVLLVKTNAQGDRLAVARRAGSLTLWDISPKPVLPFIDDELIESACGHVGRSLTAEEWAKYLPERRYAPEC